MFTVLFVKFLGAIAAHPSVLAASPLLKLKGIPQPNRVKYNPCQAPESGWEKGFRHVASMACSILTMLKNKKSGFISKAPKRKHPLSAP